MKHMDFNPEPEEVTRKLLGKQRSDFGAGVVVCLAKFAQHMERDDYIRVFQVKDWFNKTEDERGEIHSIAKKYPLGDAAALLNNIKHVIRPGDTMEDSISNAITFAMNGASDHFYDLDIEKAPPSLKKLATLVLDMGHGSGLSRRKRFTFADFEKVGVLFKQSCIELDRMLGTIPDWGQW